MNRQKQLEKRNESIDKMIANREAAKTRKSHEPSTIETGLAKVRNWLRSVNPNKEVVDDLDFRMF